MNPPFSRSYWAVPGRLLAGCYPGDLDPVQRDAKLRALLQCGVTLVVNLMEESETDHSGNPFRDYFPHFAALANPLERTIRSERFPIRDQDIPTADQMRSIFLAIHSEINSGGVIYVHCWGGKGRTATVVGCYLVNQGVESPATILNKLKGLTAHASRFFWPTPQTAEQCRFITEWKSYEI